MTGEVGRPAGFDPSRAVRVIESKSHPHFADGLVAQVALGDGAYSSILNPRSFEDGGLAWRLTWGDAHKVRYVAASVIESYDYLLSPHLTMREATDRLRKLRAARKHLCDSDGSPTDRSTNLTHEEEK
jgi:hypothetical protein